MFVFYNKHSLEMGGTELPVVQIATLYMLDIFAEANQDKGLIFIFP